MRGFYFNVVLKNYNLLKTQNYSQKTKIFNRFRKLALVKKKHR